MNHERKNKPNRQVGKFLNQTQGLPRGELLKLQQMRPLAQYQCLSLIMSF